MLPIVAIPKFDVEFGLLATQYGSCAKLRLTFEHVGEKYVCLIVEDNFSYTGGLDSLIDGFLSIFNF